VKKTAALLILGLMIVNVLHAEVRETTSSQSAAAAAASPGEPGKDKTRDDFVTLNFTNIDISALVKLMSELTRRNFILDERVTGKVTLMTPTRISPDEAYQVFLSALEMKGFITVEEGKITRIVPAASARQSALRVVKGEEFGGAGFITKLIRLTYVNPNDIVRTLSPLVSKDGTILPYPATSSIILTDSGNNIRKIESLIRALDVPALEGKGAINVYYLKNANADDFAKVMSSLVSRMPAPPVGRAAQEVSASSILEGKVTITADKATNSLIIVASPDDYEVIKSVIQKLDIRRRQVYVEVGIVEMSLAKQRELGFEFQATNVTGDISQAGRGAVGGTNFGGIGAAVAGGPVGLAGMNGLAVGAIKGTFEYNGVKYLNIGALLRALQTDGEVNVLSTPNILTMDNQKAEIMVGENVPFITGQTQNATTGSGSLFNTIDRRDVGIKLTLTPQISSDDNVRLEVNQEISDVIAGSSSNAAGPTTSKRSASTTVVVKDRDTMVIGGLIRDNLVTSTMKVPLLGDIPLLGWFFKYKTSRMEKTNLMIFITPYIIKTEADAASITNKQSQSLENFRKEYRLEKKTGEANLVPKPIASQQQSPDNAGAVQPDTELQLHSAPSGTEQMNGAAEPLSAPTGTPEKIDSGAPISSPSGTAEKRDSDAVLKTNPTGTTSGIPAEGER
jgi:general secretion pathway protein D